MAVDYSARLVRFLITYEVVGHNLFPKLREAKANRRTKQVAPWRSLTLDSVDSTGAGCAPEGGAQGDADLQLIVSARTGPRRARKARRESSAEWAAPGARSMLPPIDAYVRLYYLASRFVNWYLLLKSLLLYLLRYEPFAAWRYLDCLLLGRFVINGRVIEVAPNCSFFQAAIRLIWHYAVMRKRAGELRMPCVEFMLDKRGNRAYWARAERGARAHQSPLARSLLLEYTNPFEAQPTAGAGVSVGGGVAPASSCRRSGLHGGRLVRPTAASATSTTSDGPGNPSAARLRLRPNRTRDAWRVLAKCTILFHRIFFIIIGLLTLLFLAMGLPVALTQRGVAYNYRHCLSWAQAERRAAAANGTAGAPASAPLLLAIASQLVGPQVAALRAQGAQLDAAPRAAPRMISEFFMPMRHLVPLNRVTAVRVLMEVLESLFVYLELAWVLGAAIYMCIMMCKDVGVYCRAINSRLESLIVVLRASAAGAALQELRNTYYDSLHCASVHYRCHELDTCVLSAPEPSVCAPRPWLAHGALAVESSGAELRRETTEIQAQVADLFNHIDAYNKFLSLQSMFLLLYWLSYSALISSWIFLPGTESPKLEWYVIHCFATTAVFLMLSYMSDVKDCCRRLHRLMASAMALDEDYRVKKSTWVALMEFYKPKPLYCFTLLGSVELTYMSGFQLLVWLFSALVVASSFFQVYNIK